MLGQAWAQYDDRIVKTAKTSSNCADVMKDEPSEPRVSSDCSIERWLWVLQGKDTVAFLERLVVGDIQALKDGTGTLSVMTNEHGGIIDDTVITKVNHEEIYMVLNAGCRDKDLLHITQQLKQQSGDVNLQVHDDRALLAVQGPRAADVLQPLVREDLSKVFFGQFLQNLAIAGVGDCFLTRTGCVLALPKRSGQLPTDELMASHNSGGMRPCRCIMAMTLLFLLLKRAHVPARPRQ